MKVNFNIFQPAKDLVGIALGDAHIRAMQLAGSRGAARVVAFAECELPRTVFAPSGQVDAGGLAATLKNLFDRPKYGEFTTRDVAINLPELRCFVRLIHVAAMSDAELETAAPYEAESYIPIPIDQVYLDWQRVEEKGGRLALLLVASPQAFVDPVLSGVEKAGLFCRAVEVESQGLARAVISREEKASVLVADMKAAGTDLVMVENGGILFTSTIQVAGNSVTDVLSKAFGVSSEQAEAMKAEIGFAPSANYPGVQEALAPVINSWTSELRKVLVFYDQHYTGKVTKLFLVGGSARLKNWPELLRQGLADRPGLEIALGDPAINAKVTTPPELAGTEILSYASVMGLAMREF